MYGIEAENIALLLLIGLPKCLKVLPLHFRKRTGLIPTIIDKLTSAGKKRKRIYWVRSKIDNRTSISLRNVYSPQISLRSISDQAIYIRVCHSVTSLKG